MASRRRDEAKANLRRFGHAVRDLREQRGMTQMQLANAAGLDRAVIGYIERAERDVGISHLWDLAAGLGVSVGELVAEDDRRGPEATSVV